MPITSVNEIIKKPLSKYNLQDILKDLQELEQNNNIKKIQDFDKLFYYFQKSKTFFNKSYTKDEYIQITNIFIKILDMHPMQDIFSSEQIYFLFEKN